MATRKPARSTKRTTTKRTTTKRTTPKRRSGTRRTTTTRRRRPKLSTTLGGVFAAALVVYLTQASWPIRIAVVAAVLILLIVYFLWSRRGDIYDEMQSRRAETEQSEGDSR